MDHRWTGRAPVLARRESWEPGNHHLGVCRTAADPYPHRAHRNRPWQAQEPVLLRTSQRPMLWEGHRRRRPARQAAPPLTR
ncbi:hypothetical protein ADK76_15640 [Streptomyces griseoflavus]|nr:hypothetical protein ADK76_15640 [Streptomyces griseoflavus]